MTNTEHDHIEIAIEPKAAPQPTDADIDPAAAAFTRLEEEMALMRRAVQQLAAERADIVIPDYDPTLKEMAKQLGAVGGYLKAMTAHPAMQLTPETVADRIAVAAQSARRADQDQIVQSRTELQYATRELRAITNTVRTSADQRAIVLRTAIAGALAGALIWSFMPGTIARALPDSWQLPERMAARMVDAPTVAEAGVRLIRSQDPVGWKAMQFGAQIETQNREALSACKTKAEKTGAPVRCSVMVGN
ncbi:DUF6118 family protein [Porphyrobacter sp. ULC335]|uniref:DUF6118 family protein n=1 Tax=Porphyrobacter sp. ULC335 TaxID=2854260 RepID=UPI0022200B90|nr:DUF6118 family protein [Porphyrobacter sp. ULC335]UYV15941.1 hypothetical protein KVF90_00880 [Porphyrobacter sp. ULC335]